MVSRPSAELSTAARVRRWTLWTLLLVIVPLAVVMAMVIMLVMFVVVSQPGDKAEAPGLGCTGPDSAAVTTALSDNDGGGQSWPDDPNVGSPNQEQLDNATAIIAAGKDKNIPEYGQLIALSVAAQESGWRSVGHGDAVGPDSRGVFQQRATWGTEADRMDPSASAGLFYDELVKVDGWQNMSIGEAGQAVQVSADATGSWYAEHEPIARAAFKAITGSSAQIQCASNGQAMGCPPSPWTEVEEGLTPDALRVLRCGAQQTPDVQTVYGLAGTQDHPDGRAVDFMIPKWDTAAGKSKGDALADYFQQHHAELGVKYIIWKTAIWSVERADEGWRDCGGPNATCYAGSDPSAAHLNHVHVSVFGDAAGAPPGAEGGSSAEWVHPLQNQSYTLTVTYGQPGSWAAGYHQGVDLAISAGTPIHAGCSGTVIHAGLGGAYGNLTKIDCGGGVETWYAHQTATNVDVGDDVIAGQQIGTVGFTGRVFPAGPAGAHLHFEVRQNGTDTDPQQFYSNRGASI